MKVKLILTGIIIVLVFAFGLTYQKKTEELKVQKANLNTTLSEVKHYRTKDSLNVISLTDLQLTASQLRQSNSDAYAYIEKLEVDIHKLNKVVTTQSQTIYDLKTHLIDSVILIKDSLIYKIDTIQCINIKEKWFDLQGCIYEDNMFKGSFSSRDSLIYVEHIVPKKFLFFKWGVKERRQEILSLNPDSEILNAQYISIR